MLKEIGKEKTPPKIKAYQTVVIQHPDYSDIKAILDVWFIGKDIVFGGIGWFEFFDYEKQIKEKNKKWTKKV